MISLYFFLCKHEFLRNPLIHWFHIEDAKSAKSITKSRPLPLVTVTQSKTNHGQVGSGCCGGGLGEGGGVTELTHHAFRRNQSYPTFNRILLVCQPYTTPPLTFPVAVVPFGDDTKCNYYHSQFGLDSDFVT